MITQRESFKTRKILNRIIVLSFMVLVGFSLAKGIQSRSVMGILLALTSLGAGIYFLYLVTKIKYEGEQEETA